MKQFLIIVIAIISSINGNAQIEEEYKRYLDYDYLNHNYKYLDSNFKINISNEEFQNLARKHNFYIDRIKTYRDSIPVVISDEFDHKGQVHIASIRIKFTWLRASYYLWISEEAAKELGTRYNFKYPYRLYEYFRSNDISIWDDYMKNFMIELRNKVYEYTNDFSVLIMNTKEFTTFALVNNPQRIKDYESLTNVCKEENCCQSKDSNKEPCDSVIVSK